MPENTFEQEIEGNRDYWFAQYVKECHKNNILNNQLKSAVELFLDLQRHFSPDSHLRVRINEFIALYEKGPTDV